ncbi:radical SAM protein [Azospirillum halopraeferens]|uniref:radical SAM protein n=1 Tax=Azospirillum halopraeferens TaxID=34010 RepID=UPI00041A99DC|nr:radical SAM protein [Azospirillum halopraeferens]
MESIYYVLCWACHRRCKHCYEDRFRPYTGAALEAVVREAEENAPRIISHFPDTMLFRDAAAVGPDGTPAVRRGRIILAGGDVLVDPVRDRVLMPTLSRLRARYADSGGVRLVVQTTGDLVTGPIVEDLLRHGADHLSISGLDDFHTGMQGDRKDRLRADLMALFDRMGMVPGGAADGPPGQASYSFFGATPDQWIGKIWPRGRARDNSLSTATLADNFCNRWSGALGFLRHGQAGSEVAVDPTGAVYPCCLKTATPLGSLLEEPLTAILDSLAGHPAFEALSAGRPDRMGLTFGWSVEDFVQASKTTTPDGRPFANLCIGCDRFHERVLGPVIDSLREIRRRARHGVQPAA